MFRRCKRCSSRMLALKETILCRPCREFVEEDITVRKAEIRKALAEAKVASASLASATLLAGARKHIDVLLGYERTGMASIRPDPRLLLQRLDQLRQPVRTTRTTPETAPRLCVEVSPASIVPDPGPTEWLGEEGPSVIFLGGGSEAGDSGPTRCDELDREAREDGVPTFWLGNDLGQLGPTGTGPLHFSDKKVEGPPKPELSSPTERRASSRRSADFRILIRPLGVQALVRDLCTQGIYIQTDAMKSCRKPLKLTFQTRKGEVSTVGVVRRFDQRAGSARGVLRNGMAIQFKEALEGLTDSDCREGVITFLSENQAHPSTLGTV